jgi:hypothetical protein
VQAAGEAAQAAAQAAAAAASAIDQEKKHAHHAHTRKYERKKRKQPPDRGLTKKEKRLMDSALIGKALNDQQCCTHDCTRRLSVEAVLPLRTKYCALGHEQPRTDFIVDLILATNPGGSSARKLKWLLLGVDCKRGFRKILGISQKKLRRAVQQFRAGRLLPPVHGSTATAHATPQADAAFGYLTHYFAAVCDDVPSARGVQRIMTMYRSWPEVNRDCVREFTANHAASPLKFKSPSYAVFERVRLRDFGNVVRPRKGSQPSCTVCVSIGAERERCSDQDRAALNEQMAKHAAAHLAERKGVQAEIDAALAAGNTLVCRIDYTSSALLPHFRLTPKVWISLCRRPHFCLPNLFLLQVLSRKQAIEVRVSGLYVQGGEEPNNGLYLVLHLNSIAKDGNALCTQLFQVISNARLAKHTELLLSFDNAPGEAKNAAVIALCVLIVSLSWFQRVRIVNLLPGHTHNVLDAFFSHIQRALSTHTIVSVADIVDALSHAFSAAPLKPKLIVLQQSLDWWSFFEPCLRPIAGHSTPLGFSFETVAPVSFSVPASAAVSALSGAAVESSASASAPARMLLRDGAQKPWLGLERTAQPIEVLTELPRGLPKALPLNRPIAEEAKAQEETIATALKHLLLHQAEAAELVRIVREGTLGAVAVAASSHDSGVGVAAKVARPGTDNTFSVRLIAERPNSLQPPPMRASAAPAAVAKPKPPVPIFFKPRVSVITHRKHKLKQLREEAEKAEAAAERQSAAGAGAGSGSGATPQSVSAAAAVAQERKSPAPVRKSPRTTKPSQSPTAMVGWDSIDDEMDED